MKRTRLLVLISLLGILTACGGGGEPEPTPTRTPPPAPTLPPIATRSPQASPTPVNAYPPGTRTQVEVIDAALSALEAGDAAAFEDLLSFHPYRCATAPAGVVGANPCPPGVAEGSAVDVIAVSECEVSFLARERAGLRAELAEFLAAAAGQRVYAVTEVQPGRLSSPLPLRYLVILSGGYSLLLDDAGVTHLGTPCQGVGPAQLYHPADAAILEPL